MTSLTNKIIANIKQSTNNVENFYTSDNVICIDSSFLRLGINTKSPNYAIDISGTDSESIINSKNIIINNLAKINEISCNLANIIHSDMSSVDISFCKIHTLSGNFIDISSLKTNTIDINTLVVPTISSDTITVNTLSGDTLDISNLIVYSLTIENNLSFAGNFALEYIEANKSYIRELSSNDICSNFLYSYDNSSTNLYVENDASSNNLYANNLYILNEAIFSNDISINGSAIMNDISVNGDASFNSINADSINVLTLTANNEPVVTNGIFDISIGKFNTLNVDDIAHIGTVPDITSLHVKGNLMIDNGELKFSNTGKFVLPSYNINNYYTAREGTLTYDDTTGILKLRTTGKWNDLDSKKILATYSLDDTYLGNDISINNAYRFPNNPDATINKFYIDNSNNLLLKDTAQNIIDISNYKYKFIPLKSNKFINSDMLNNDYNTSIEDYNNIDLNNQIFTNDVSCIFVGKQSSDNGSSYLNQNTLINYEITANLTIRYLNKNPNDVEINNYTFGIYPNMSIHPGQDIGIEDLNKLSIQNKFISINNSIIVFDNSYNLSNISLTYNGTLGNNANPISANNKLFKNGFKFYISSTKDINYLQIDSFYCSIKQL
tara:strand:+ start:4660 stop:6492 length:1833 start_codon:yes stop_codon:yes gene_type:complete